MLNSWENLLKTLTSRLGSNYNWGGYWPSLTWKIIKLVSNLLIHQSVNEQVNEVIQQIIFHSENGLKDNWTELDWTEWLKPIATDEKIRPQATDNIKPQASEDVHDILTTDNIIPQPSEDVQDVITTDNIIPHANVDVDVITTNSTIPYGNVDVQDVITTDSIIPHASIVHDSLISDNNIPDASVIQEVLTTDNVIPHASLDVLSQDVASSPTDHIVILSDNDQERENNFDDEEKEESKIPKFSPTVEKAGSNHEDFQPLTEINDDEKSKSAEIVLNPECLPPLPELSDNPERFPRSQTSLTIAPIRGLSRRLSFSEKIFKTAKRNFSSPLKSNDNSANRKKENSMKIILF